MDQRDVVIQAHQLGKCYHIYKKPQDRLWQFVYRGKRQFYDEFWANRDIDLEVYKGETLGIVGRNGAGKTTLLQMIAGTLHPTAGELEVKGRVTALLELGSGFDMDFTGRENVFLSGAVLGIPRREMDKRFDEIVEFAGIGDFLEQPVKTYSKGMFVRLAFSVLASLDPDIFVVDEAIAVGDAYFRQRCMRRFNEMRERGTTILYVSHDGGSMKRLCNRVAWIDGGKLREVGPPSEVVDNYLSELFGQEVRDGEGSGEVAALSRAVTEAPPAFETHIPNVDRRLGDQRLRIQGVGLYSPQSKPLASTDHGGEVVLRMTASNEGYADPIEWVPGYILRNSRGEDVASGNSHFEGTPMQPLGTGERRTVRIRFHLPFLQPGTYSLVPTLAVRNDEGRLEIADQIDAALVFQITAVRHVSAFLAMETQYELEEAGDRDAAGAEPSTEDPRGGTSRADTPTAR